MREVVGVSGEEGLVVEGLIRENEELRRVIADLSERGK
jgi:hypothetical protein